VKETLSTVPEGSRWKRFRCSFVFAGRGVIRLLKTEPNAQVHAVATAAVGALGFWLGLNATEWCLILFAIVFVWVAEGLNSALEALADRVAPERHPLIERAKDVAAGAVLIAAIGAAIVGMIVLGPKLLARLG
jgi:diacylglycerol kinase